MGNPHPKMPSALPDSHEDQILLCMVHERITDYETLTSIPGPV
jgi:hypothetical protein